MKQQPALHLTKCHKMSHILPVFHIFVSLGRRTLMGISFDFDEAVTYSHRLLHILTYFLSECAFLCVLVR